MSLLLSAVISYLIGSVNSAILLVRGFFHKDIRSSGSGNAGATNAGRSYGAGVGVLTLLCDVLKAVVSCAIGKALGGEAGQAVAGLFCLVGHCWPVFFHFRGGKGMAVGAGTVFFLDWRAGLIMVAVFAVVFLIGRRVSLSTIVTALAFPAVYYALHRTFDVNLALTAVMVVLIVFQHRSNIARILNGTEPKFAFKHTGKK